MSRFKLKLAICNCLKHNSLQSHFLYLKKQVKCKWHNIKPFICVYDAYAMKILKVSVFVTLFYGNSPGSCRTCQCLLGPWFKQQFLHCYISTMLSHLSYIQQQFSTLFYNPTEKQGSRSQHQTS